MYLCKSIFISNIFETFFVDTQSELKYLFAYESQQSLEIRYYKQIANLSNVSNGVCLIIISH